MEEIIRNFIYIHAFFGGLGLITGVGSIVVKKGSKPHKIMGKLFSIGMILSSLISIPISWMPNHKNMLLFLIGIFTIYLVISGNRALTFKSREKKEASSTDKLLSGSMLLLSVLMVLFGTYGLITVKALNYLLFVFFGSFGLLLTINDFIIYKKYLLGKNEWLRNHIGKMMGAFIASVTAFLVAGLGIWNLFAWMLPSILGTVYILYWKRKLKINDHINASKVL